VIKVHYLARKRARRRLEPAGLLDEFPEVSFVD
jgi:hypothetical protein